MAQYPIGAFAFDALEVDRPPFDAPIDAAARRGVTWVRPSLVVEVEFTGWTPDGSLRHPSFQGMREDKSAREVVKETPKQHRSTTTTKTKATTTKKKTKAKTKRSRG